MGAASTVTVSVQLPEELIEGEDPERLSSELRALWAVERVRRKLCGIGKAAEIAGLPRAAFMQMLGEHGIPVIDFGVDDLLEELGDLAAS